MHRLQPNLQYIFRIIKYSYLCLPQPCTSWEGEWYAVDATNTEKHNVETRHVRTNGNAQTVRTNGNAQTAYKRKEEPIKQATTKAITKAVHTKAEDRVRDIPADLHKILKRLLLLWNDDVCIHFSRTSTLVCSYPPRPYRTDYNPIPFHHTQHSFSDSLFYTFPYTQSLHHPPSPMYTLPSKLFVELVGTFIFINVIFRFAGEKWGGFAIGVTLAVMVLFGGAVSGGYFNPAVTLAMFVGGKIPGLPTLAYIIAQLVGGYLAYVMYTQRWVPQLNWFIMNSLWIHYRCQTPSHYKQSPSTPPGHTSSPPPPTTATQTANSHHRTA